jgi:UDP-glucose 4-epimerase
MKILITGGAGFIGSHVADAYIADGHDVCVIDNLSTGKIENVNPKAKLYEIDLNDSKINDIFKSEQFEVVNHHAAQMDVRISVGDPIFDARTNVLGSLNIYEAALKNGVKKLIFASSGGTVYGEQQYFPADESHPNNPCSPYGVAKLANEYYLNYYALVHGIDTAILRYANIYGPRQNPHGEAGVVAIFLNKMLTGATPQINGDGKNTRDYVYISDVVEANRLALKDDFKGIFNIGTACEHDVNFIFRELNALCGNNAEEFHGEPKQGEQRRSVLSFEKIRKEHSWQPQVKFAEGLKLTYDYYKSLI